MSYRHSFLLMLHKQPNRCSLYVLCYDVLCYGMKFAMYFAIYFIAKYCTYIAKSLKHIQVIVVICHIYHMCVLIHNIFLSVLLVHY
jgi:hypothetical protein